MSDTEMNAALFEVDDHEAPSAPPKKRAAAKAAKKYSLEKDLKPAMVETDDEDAELGFDDYPSEDDFHAKEEEEDDDDDEELSEGEQTTDDEDVAPPSSRDEHSRPTVVVRRVTGDMDKPLRLLRAGAVNVDKVPAKCLVDPGTIKPRYRAKEAKLSDVAHIMVNDDDAVHALPVLNERTNELTYNELTFADEQLILRAALAAIGPKVNYAHLQSEQERWDMMTFEATVDGKMPAKYKDIFAVRKVKATGRYRPFIVSSLFCKTRRDRIAKSRSKRDAKKTQGAVASPEKKKSESAGIPQVATMTPRPVISKKPKTEPPEPAKPAKETPARPVKPKPVSRSVSLPAILESKEEASPKTPKRPIKVDPEVATRAPKRPKRESRSLPFMSPGTGLCVMVFPAGPEHASQITDMFARDTPADLNL